MKPAINIYCQPTPLMWSVITMVPAQGLTDEAGNVLTDENKNILTPERPLVITGITDEKGNILIEESTLPPGVQPPPPYIPPSTE